MVLKMWNFLKGKFCKIKLNKIVHDRFIYKYSIIYLDSFNNYLERRFVMLTNRSLAILQNLIKNGGNGNIKILAEQNGISERSVRYDIDNINEYLNDKGLSGIEKLSKGNLKIDKTSKIEEYLYKNYKQYLLVPEDRVTYILIEILFNGLINLNKISQELDISRSTVKIDLKNVKEILERYSLELRLKHRTGLVLLGEEDKIRKLKLKILMKYFRQYEIYKKGEAAYSLKDIFIIEELDRYIGDISIENIKVFIDYIQKLINKIISDEAYDIITSYLIISIFRIRKEKFLDKVQNENFLKNTQEYNTITRGMGILEANYGVNLSELEVLKITDYFLGSHTYNFDYSYYENWVEVEILVKKLIEKFDQKIDVDISKDNILLDGLINHIKPTLYRIKNSIELQNSIYDEVFDSYPNLFNITSEVIGELEEFIDGKLSKDEIAFLVIHFKAAIDRNKHKIKDVKKVLIVCGLGYGSSKLLAQQIKETYTIDIVDIIPNHFLEKYLNNPEIDLIITTLDIHSLEKGKLDTPVVKVNPILGKEDIHKLDKYGLPKYRKKVLLSDVLEIIEENTIIEDKEKLLKKLELLLEDRLINDLNEKELDITDLLKLENIKLNLEVDSLEKAIERAGNILVERGYVKNGYVKNMTDIVKEYGSYIVVSNGIAMPHARGGENVYKTGMSLITLKNPVKFSDGKEVEILIAFSSFDDKEHLNSLVDLMNLINDYEFKDNLKRMKKSKDVLKFIYKYKLG